VVPAYPDVSVPETRDDTKGTAKLQPLPQIEIEKKKIYRHDDIKLLRDLPFSRNLPLKLGDD